jgi:hypothetical protein
MATGDAGGPGTPMADMSIRRRIPTVLPFLNWLLRRTWPNRPTCLYTRDAGGKSSTDAGFGLRPGPFLAGVGFGESRPGGLTMSAFSGEVRHTLPQHISTLRYSYGKVTRQDCRQPP